MKYVTVWAFYLIHFVCIVMIYVISFYIVEDKVVCFVCDMTIKQVTVHDEPAKYRQYARNRSKFQDPVTLRNKRIANTKQ